MYHSRKENSSQFPIYRKGVRYGRCPIYCKYGNNGQFGGFMVPVLAIWVWLRIKMPGQNWDASLAPFKAHLPQFFEPRPAFGRKLGCVPWFFLPLRTFCARSGRPSSATPPSSRSSLGPSFPGGGMAGGLVVGSPPPQRKKSPT